MAQQTDHIGDTNKMVTMKLYTEEQVMNALKLAHSHIKPLQYVIDTLTPIELPSDEELAILFHNKYEELAPKFKYETKIETKKFNKDSNNGKLMIAVCKQILEILNQNK